MPLDLSVFAVFIILVALIFDFTNGMHDAANSISTVVSTRVLTPRQAVVWATFFNFIAFLVFGTAVAETIGGKMVDIPAEQSWIAVVFAGLIGAIAWNIITWLLGLPSSSSHALIGGLGGAAIAKGGFHVIKLGGWYLPMLFIIIAPLIGLFVGFLLKVIVTWMVHRQPAGTVNFWSRILQLFSAAAYSLGHGGNDAQKTMGIILIVLYAEGAIPEIRLGLHENLWVILVAHSAIALGTMSGGWRIVKTMGQKITKLKPVGGFCAETGGALTLFIATGLGIPVSTTHTITGAIVGVGSTQRASAVRWGVAGNIVWAWILTIPASALVAALGYWVSLVLF